MSLDLVTAAEAKTLVEDLGMSGNQASQQLGIARSTVGEIVNGQGRWADLKEKDPLFKQIRQEQKERWWKSIWSLQPKLLQHIEKKLEDSTAASATWMFGVLFDKERMLAGESTSNIVVEHHLEAEQIADAAERIAHSLLRFSENSNAVTDPQNEAIDVTPTDSESKV